MTMKMTHTMTESEVNNWQTGDWGLPTREANNAFASSLIFQLYNGFTLPVSEGLKAVAPDLGDTIPAMPQYTDAVALAKEILDELISQGRIRKIKPFGKAHYRVREIYTVIWEWEVEANTMSEAEIIADDSELPADLEDALFPFADTDHRETEIVPMEWDGTRWV